MKAGSLLTDPQQREGDMGPEATETEQSTEAATGVEPVGAESNDEVSFDAAYVRKLRAESAKYRQQAKENATAAARLAEIENSQKSELEKAAERADTAEKRAAALEAQVLRSEVAAAKGLTPAQARRLVGATREELEADADDFLQSLAPTHVVKAAPSPEDTGAGVAGAAAVTDPLALAAGVLKRR